MTTLTSRPAQLGPTINDRTEMHGNEGKPALDLTITGIVLSAEEYNAIAQHPGAYAGVMDTSSNPPKFAYPGSDAGGAPRRDDQGLRRRAEARPRDVRTALAGCSFKGGAVAFEHGVPALSGKLQHEGELTGEQLLKLRAAKGKSVDIELVLGARDRLAPHDPALR
jgi:hypothetical protein